MPDLLLFPFVTIVTIACMEIVVALIHRYVMHGFGWRWHASHHEISATHRFELNDLYAIIPVFGCIALFAYAGGPGVMLWWVALGMTLYGLFYAIMHEGLVHKRWLKRFAPQHPYVQRLIVAHHLHHAVRTQHDGVSFGFLYAPPVEALRAKLRRRSNV